MECRHCRRPWLSPWHATVKIRNSEDRRSWISVSIICKSWAGSVVRWKYQYKWKISQRKCCWQATRKDPARNVRFESQNVLVVCVLQGTLTCYRTRTRTVNTGHKNYLLDVVGRSVPNGDWCPLIYLRGTNRPGSWNRNPVSLLEVEKLNFWKRSITKKSGSCNIYSVPNTVVGRSSRANASKRPFNVTCWYECIRDLLRFT